MIQSGGVVIKKRVIILVIFLFTLASTAFTQKMTVKDIDLNVLTEVNDEGTIGSITLPSGSAPGTTTNKLYNASGALYWNGLKTTLYVGYMYTTGSASNSSGTWTDTGVTFEFSLPSDKMVNLRASGTVWGSGSSDVAAFRFAVNGTPYGDTNSGDRLVSCGQVYGSWYLERPISLTSGAHTAKVQFRRSSGSGTIYVNLNSTMSQMFVEAF